MCTQTANIGSLHLIYTGVKQLLPRMILCSNVRLMLMARYVTASGYYCITTKTYACYKMQHYLYIDDFLQCHRLQRVTWFQWEFAHECRRRLEHTSKPQHRVMFVYQESNGTTCNLSHRYSQLRFILNQTKSATAEYTSALFSRNYMVFSLSSVSSRSFGVHCGTIKFWIWTGSD